MLRSIIEKYTGKPQTFYPITVKEPEVEQKLETPLTPKKSRELLLAEAKECIDTILRAMPMSEYEVEQERIRKMYEKMQFISDEREELIIVDFSSEHKKKSAYLKKYKDFESLSDEDLPLYINFLNYEMCAIITPLKNALVDQACVANQVLHSLPSGEEYKILLKEIDVKIKTYQFSWASLQDFKEFNKRIVADKEALDVERKKTLSEKLTKVVAEGVALAGTDERLRKCFEEALDEKKGGLKDIEFAIGFVERIIARHPKEKVKIAVSLVPISSSPSAMYGKSSLKSASVIADPLLLEQVMPTLQKGS